MDMAKGRVGGKEQISELLLQEGRSGDRLEGEARYLSFEREVQEA